MRASNRMRMKRRTPWRKIFIRLRKMRKIKLKSVIAEILSQERQMMSWLSNLSGIPPIISPQNLHQPIL
jgi:hypothetical protein